MSGVARGTILVVDDEVNFCRILAAQLENEGFTVQVAYDGLEAVEKAKQWAFDLVVLDERMPVMSGLKAVEALREINEKLPVIIMTAYDTPELRQQVKSLRVSGYLVKPFDIQELTELIEQILKPEIPAEVMPEAFLARRVAIFETHQPLKLEIRTGRYRRKSYYTHLESQTLETITVRPPLLQPPTATLHPQTKLTVSFVGEDALYSFDSQVLSHELDPFPRLVLSKPTSLQRLQRREFPRAELNQPAKYTLLKPLEMTPISVGEGIVENISLGGVKIVVPHKISKTRILRIEIRLPDQPEVIAQTGEVVRVSIMEDKEKEYELGLRFLEPYKEPRIQAMINDFVMARLS